MAVVYSVSREYKSREDYRFKLVKRDRRLFGEIREYPKRPLVNGRLMRIYWTVRLKGEFIAKHSCWAFDKAVIDTFGNLGIPLTHIGILVSADTNRRANIEEKIEEKYLIKKSDFNLQALKREDYPGQLLIPIGSFARILRELDPEHKYKEMIVRK